MLASADRFEEMLEADHVVCQRTDGYGPQSHDMVIRIDENTLLSLFNCDSF
jgi:hypothetical protein